MRIDHFLKYHLWPKYFEITLVMRPVIKEAHKKVKAKEAHVLMCACF